MIERESPNDGEEDEAAAPVGEETAGRPFNSSEATQEERESGGGSIQQLFLSQLGDSLGNCSDISIEEGFTQYYSAARSLQEEEGRSARLPEAAAPSGGGGGGGLNALTPSSGACCSSGAGSPSSEATGSGLLVSVVGDGGDSLPPPGSVPVGLWPLPDRGRSRQVIYSPVADCGVLLPSSCLTD